MVVIYGIECLPTKFVYVGCTECGLAKRCREHFSLLKNSKHSCTKMVEDFAQYGKEAFAARILEELPHNTTLGVKRDREIKWMSKFRDEGRLYNHMVASFGMGTKPKGWKPSPESNLKRRLAQLGKPKGHGAKISATKKALGQKPSREAWLKGQMSMMRNKEAKRVVR
jgi:group I intron endonuclease